MDKLKFVRDAEGGWNVESSAGGRQIANGVS
jgi:hypothetical protein